MRELPDKRPDIDYPTRWGYRLIGPDADAVRTAVADIIGAFEHKLVPSHQSANGKYHSFSLELEVQSEEQRLEYFEAFRAHPAIVYVL